MRSAEKPERYSSNHQDIGLDPRLEKLIAHIAALGSEAEGLVAQAQRLLEFEDRDAFALRLDYAMIEASYSVPGYASVRNCIKQSTRPTRCSRRLTTHPRPLSKRNSLNLERMGRSTLSSMRLLKRKTMLFMSHRKATANAHVRPLSRGCES